MFQRSLSSLVGAGLLLLAASAHATVLVSADLAEMARRAQAIVHGVVVDVQPQWTDGRGRIESVVTVQILDRLKGDLGDRTVFQVPGGQIGRYRSVLVGAPAFQVGDEAILFLGGQGPVLPYVIGLGQGVFRVVQDRATGRPMVTPPALVAQSTAPQTVVRGDPARKPVPLDQFLSQVRALSTATANVRDVRASRVPGKRK